jgi:hypothetical protein
VTVAAPRREITQNLSYASRNAEDLLGAQQLVERGQKPRQMVHLLRAVHHQVAGVIRRCAENPRRHRPDNAVGQTRRTAHRDEMYGPPSQNRDRISLPSPVARMWWTNQPASTGTSRGPSRAQMGTVVSSAAGKPSVAGMTNRIAGR